MQCGKTIRLLFAITVLDCIIAAVIRPALMLLAGHTLNPWQDQAAHLADVGAVLFAPVQCIALWLLLRPVWSKQRVLRRVRLRTNAILRSGADLQIAFQPVISTNTGAVVAVEALARFPGTQTPDKWFAQAGEVDLGVELELVALRRALAEAAKLSVHLDVAVNLSPCA